MRVLYRSRYKKILKCEFGPVEALFSVKKRGEFTLRPGLSVKRRVTVGSLNAWGEERFPRLEKGLRSPLKCRFLFTR